MPETSQTQFNSWFDARVVAAFAVGSVVAGIILWFTGQLSPLTTQQAVMQQQLDNIKNNDLAHIEVEISQLSGQQSALQTQVNDENNKLTQIITVLNGLKIK